MIVLRIDILNLEIDKSLKKFAAMIVKDDCVAHFEFGAVIFGACPFIRIERLPLDFED